MSDKYQEIFDTVWNGLKSQGFQKSVNEEGSCKYRGMNGLRCAAGWLIPDEAYYEEWDNCGGASARYVPFLTKKFIVMEIDFIEELQNNHDLSDGPEEMKASLLWTAEKFIRNFDRNKYV